VQSRASNNDPPDNPAGQYTTQVSDVERDMNPDAPGVDIHAIVSGNSEFAFELYQEIAEEGKNLVFSPYSISQALAMTYAGARGETERQMADTLHFTLPQDKLHPAFNAIDLKITASGSSGRSDPDSFRLSIANSLWGQKDFTFLPEFLDLLARDYGAGMNLVDFVGDTEGARVTINNWVEEKTEDRIRDLIPPGVLSVITRLVLVNAIYFDAKWLNMFEKESTYDSEFHPLDGTAVDVPMMHQEEYFEYGSGDGYQIISLPYKNRTTAMYVILPDEGNFTRFENTLDLVRLDEILSGMDGHEVSLAMPKFEYSGDFGLKDTLSEMGMPLAFDGVDFAGMTGDDDLFIRDVIHKAFVKVDEEGTEAAAATAVVMDLGMAMPPEDLIEMTIDRPFIYMIMDEETKSILFLGRVMNPAA
jgi:serpin B